MTNNTRACRTCQPNFDGSTFTVHLSQGSWFNRNGLLEKQKEVNYSLAFCFEFALGQIALKRQQFSHVHTRITQANQAAVGITRIFAPAPPTHHG